MKVRETKTPYRKDKLQTGEKKFTNNTFNKELVFRIYKELSNFKSRDNTLRKWAKYLSTSWQVRSGKNIECHYHVEKYKLKP